MRVSILFGVSIGLALALADVGLLVLLGVQMQVAGRDATTLVLVFFAVNYAFFGGLCGALWSARARLASEAERVRCAHADLAEAQGRLVQAERLAAVGRMAAGVAHEVKNPLGVIRSAAGLLAEDAPSEDARRASAFIIAEVDRLDAFVRRVLDFSRPLAPHRDPVDVDALARQLAERADAELEGHAGMAELDPVLVTAAVLALTDNARTWRRGAVRIRLGEGPWIEVADDGPGVPPGDAPRLFEPFFTTRADGTGLGLAIAARIATAHDGRLRYLSGRGLGPEGAGACFRLELS